MTRPDDAALARAAQAGDATGLGVLFERHRARLHAVAVGMLGHGPDADDAVQDAIVIAMRRIGELREPAAARGWLVAILVNVCRARLRRPVRELPARTPSSRVARSTPCRGRWSAARCATGCGRRSSACPSRSGWRSCCATSRAQTPTSRSPTSATSRSAPCAAA